MTDEQNQPEVPLTEAEPTPGGGVIPAGTLARTKADLIDYVAFQLREEDPDLRLTAAKKIATEAVDNLTADELQSFGVRDA